MARISGLVLAAMLGLLLATSGAAAQNRKPTPLVEPKPTDPKAVLKAARSAILSLRTATYTARMEAYGRGAEHGEVYSAAVSVHRLITGAPVMARIAVRGEAQRKETRRPLHLVYDGNVVRWLDAGGKVTESPPGDGHGTLLAREELYLVPTDLVLAEPLTQAIDSGTATHEGRQSVEGVECDVLLLEYTPIAPPGAPRQQARWLIGVLDHLPRRIEYPTPARPDGTTLPDSGVRLTLSQLQLNKPIEPATFRMPPPGPKTDPSKPPPPPLEPRKTPLGVRDTAPDWALPDGNGVERRLSEFAGKVVVLDFWATWCQPCLKAMPGLQSLHERYAGKDVIIIGLSTAERGDPVRAPVELFRTRGFTYGLLVKADEVAKGYGVSGFPTLFVIGRDGRVILREVAVPDMQRIARAIDQELKSAKPPKGASR